MIAYSASTADAASSESDRVPAGEGHTQHQGKDEKLRSSSVDFACEVRVEFAARLFDREQISLGLAAKIAGLSYSEMIDELGSRRIDVTRYSEEEWSNELDYVRTVGGS